MISDLSIEFNEIMVEFLTVGIIDDMVQFWSHV